MSHSIVNKERYYQQQQLVRISFVQHTEFLEYFRLNCLPLEFV